MRWRAACAVRSGLAAARRSSVIEMPTAACKPAPAKPAAKRSTARPRKAAVSAASEQNWQEF